MKGFLELTEEKKVDADDSLATLSIPLLIRLMEYAREDAKDDMALHFVAEKVSKLCCKGPIGMKDYNNIIKR